MSGLVHKYAIVFEKEHAIGFTMTTHEADDICKKYSRYTWGTTKSIPKDLPMLVFSTFDPIQAA